MCVVHKEAKEITYLYVSDCRDKKCDYLLNVFVEGVFCFVYALECGQCTVKLETL
jgi:hypothetical protein